MTPNEVKNTLLVKSIAGAISDVGFGSPNLLLYIGDGNGGGTVPVDPSDPTDPSDPADPSCGGFFNETSGAFASPNYPQDYDNNMVCDYVFSAADDKAMIINFNNFELESSSTCRYDSVEIYDSTGALTGTYCGTDSPGRVLSQGTTTVRFQSDSSVTYSGFSGVYAVTDATELPETGECGHVFTKPNGILTSPNYPSDYDNSDTCEFTIKGSPSETVTLTFTDFDVESHSSCAWDAVEVYETDSNGQLLARLCGSSIPSPITSTTSSMYVRFTTDSSVSATGFRALYAIA